ncbi:hypothetical protein D9M69_643050 [compost metagenome]
MAVVPKQFAEAQRRFSIANRILSPIPDLFGKPRDDTLSSRLDANQQSHITGVHAIVFSAVAGFAQKLKLWAMRESE